MSLRALMHAAARCLEPDSMQELLTLIVSRPELDIASQWQDYLADSDVMTYGQDFALTAAEWNQLLTIPCGEWSATALARALFSPASIANLRSTEEQPTSCLAAA